MSCFFLHHRLCINKCFILVLLFHANHNPAMLSQVGPMSTRPGRTRGEVGRKWVRDTLWKRERERPFCPPGMTESLMQKDPTWREGGEVCVVGSMKELLASFPRSPTPSLKHICLLFSVTHPFPLVLTHPLTPVKETFAWSDLRMFTRATGATIFQQLSRDCALWLPVILFLAMVYSPRT